MALRKNTLVLLILISSFSIFIASISDIISVNIDAMEEKAIDSGNKMSHISEDRGNIMSNKADNLMWFLQVTGCLFCINFDSWLIRILWS